jgi:hypothetical protein
MYTSSLDLFSIFVLLFLLCNTLVSTSELFFSCCILFLSFTVAVLISALLLLLQFLSLSYFSIRSGYIVR